MITASLLLAAALLVGSGPAGARLRAGVITAPRPKHREPSSSGDPFAAASALDVLSVCLSGGMTVPAAARATAASAPPALGGLLDRAADLLALGADPESAWVVDHSEDDCCAALARLARRSASSGSALARGATDLAEQSRQDAAHAAAAAAEKAGVHIAGPLGLCFLPAFVCLGIVPVVAGLAGKIFGTGLL